MTGETQDNANDNGNGGQPLQSVDAPQELGATIPAYDDCSAEEQAYVDEIIAKCDLTDPEFVAAFGQEPIQKMNDDMMAIHREMAENREGVYSDALAEFTETLDGLGLDDAQDLAGNLTEKGKSTLGYLTDAGRRNWKELAVAGAGVVATPFTLGAGAVVTAAALGKLGYNEYTREPDANEKMAQLEVRLAKNIKGLLPAIDRLKEISKTIPDQRKRLKGLQDSYEGTVTETVLHLVAAAEIRKRFETEIDAAKTNNDTKKAARLERLRGLFDNKTTMMETVYAHGASALVGLELRKESLIDLQTTFQSVTGPEVATIMGQAAQANVSLMNFRTANAVHQFRNQTDEMEADAREVRLGADQMTRDTRFDSAVRLKKLADNLKQQQTDMKEADTANAKDRVDSVTAREEIMKQTASLLTAAQNRAAHATDLAEDVQGQATEQTAEQTTQAPVRKMTLSGG